MTALVVWPHRASPFADPTTRASARSRAALSAHLAARTLRIIMAGGGTGGHLYPGLAVAEALEQLVTQAGGTLELTWAATPRQVDQHLLSGFGTRYVPQPVQPLVPKITKLWSFWSGWRKSCRYWRNLFAQSQIDTVLALGGYAAGPAAYVASRTGVAVGLLNPDAVPGRANRFLLKRAQRIFTQWDLPTGYASSIPGRVMPLGCPIRESILGRPRADGAARLSMDPARKTFVITGGSLAAKNVNDAVLALLRDEEVGRALVTGHWQILHLAGSAQAAAVKAAYEPLTTIPWRVLDYCDDMASVYAIADLVLARAGASTCAELTACGVPSILMPYPYHRDQHQRHNAERLVEAGAAVLVDDRKDAVINAAAVKKALLSLWYDDARRQRMARSAQAAGKPHAAREIAQELLTLIRT